MQRGTLKARARDCCAAYIRVKVRLALSALERYISDAHLYSFGARPHRPFQAPQTTPAAPTTSLLHQVCFALQLLATAQGASSPVLHGQAGDELGGDVLGAVAGEANAEDAAILDMVTSTADDWQR